MTVQGDKLEITVIGCKKLKDTELLGRQDPFVEFEYGGRKYRTETCKRGGTNPKFGDKFEITLTEGRQEINVSVWNRNKILSNDFIGSGSIQLERVLRKGFHDSVWQLQTKSSGYAGDLRLIMYYPKPSVTSRLLGYFVILLRFSIWICF